VSRYLCIDSTRAKHHQTWMGSTWLELIEFLSSRKAPLYRYLPAWTASVLRRTRSRYRVAHVVDVAPGSQ